MYRHTYRHSDAHRKTYSDIHTETYRQRNTQKEIPVAELLTILGVKKK